MQTYFCRGGHSAIAATPMTEDGANVTDFG
jgi:hypothetical protein